MLRQPKPINERTEEDVSPRLAHCTDQRVEPGESTCPVPLAARMRAPRTKQFATHHLQVELLVRAQAIHAWPDTAQGHPLARHDVPLHFLCDKAIHLRSLQGTPMARKHSGLSHPTTHHGHSQRYQHTCLAVARAVTAADRRIGAAPLPLLLPLPWPWPRPTPAPAPAPCPPS